MASRELKFIRLLWVLIVWTLFIWSNRLRNAVADGDLVGSEKNWAVFTAASFIAGSLVLAVLGFLWRRSTVPIAVLFYGVVVFAGLSLFRWVWRSPIVLLGSEGAGFKLVHTVLALITIGLSIVTIHNVTRLYREPGLDT